ncbi:Pre-mRNA-splicing factor CWC26 [Grifola frondosa]|uniref:Pre-mRNA-splicing factor CWC26 n=1 Tax=Grifola frondosa TaxID=5627 RepID=A0A1C7LTQ3_GRIFR|nr:Pre-mRNA-splicing factor CWC26 [Grifola frondosa]
MQAYLAAKYMSGPKADAILARTSSGAPKKKKRKTTASTSTPGASSSIIKDEDILGWGDAPRDEEEDDIAEAVIAEDRRFKKRQRKDAESGWTTLREGEGGETTPPPAEDEQPQFVVEEEPTAFAGGLVTSTQLKKTLPRAPDKRATAADKEEREAAQETVYRDSSGRRVDIAAERAEAARLKREREEREARKMEWGKGLVQREDAEKRKREEETMRSRTFARSKDDVELNAELKAQERWNDPAAAFLTKKRSKGPRKPEYTGPPPPPNRFGIKPGYRWDGVDRGNGFEKKLFQRQNEKRRRGAESYEWSVDEM